MTRSHRFIQLPLAALLFIAAAQVQARSDAAFMKQAAQNGAAEIEASQLAGTKAKSADVKSFAATMVSDHTKVAGELKQLAASKKVDLPEGPSVKQKAGLKLLGAADGDAFDARYAKDFGIDAHQDTIKLFEQAAKEAKDPEVKAWAQKTLPSLQHHLEMARSLPAAPKSK
jgi:putative membrane protein